MARLIPVLVLIVVAMAATAGFADEGMWQLNKLDQAPYETWSKAGLTLDPASLYTPGTPSVADAIVQLGGGTASFVSRDGLIVTNHHVAFGALQRQSEVGADLMELGFLARTRAEEIPAPGYNAYVLKNIEDVTKTVLSSVTDKMSPSERFDAIDQAGKKLVEKAEAAGDVEADIESFFGGSEYHLYTYFKIKDVRIVYAPPGGIGVYGGQIDNWMWPRHTGDFSFLRAYVGPGGESADYNESNVPYQPDHFLKFSVGQLREGDLTMVMGYPGKTQRHQSSWAIDYVVNRYYPERIQQYGDLIETLEQIGEGDPEAAVRIASTIRGLSNSYKNNKGMLAGLLRTDLLAQKRAQEDAIREYLATDKQAAAEYGDVLDDMAALYTERLTYASQQGALSRAVYFTSAVRSAYTVVKWAREQEKDDIERDKGYQARDEEKLRKRLELADRRYAEVADKAILTYYIVALGAMDGDKLTSLDGVKDVDSFVAGLYKGTAVTEKAQLLEMFGKSSKELAAMKDPMLDFAMRLLTDDERFDERGEAFKGAMSGLAPRMLELRAMVSDTPLYPDANFTMRLSVGAVRGYSPRDAVRYEPFTTLDGVVQKYTGEKPFDAPEGLISLAERRDYGQWADPDLGDVPVCFLSTDDITGGNSGSPVLNANGDLIGLVFDSNLEAVSADYQFTPSITRAIHVDSRYIMFIVDRFAGATELLNELTVVDGTEGAMR